MYYKVDSNVLTKKELCFYEIQTSHGYMEDYGLLNLGILYILQSKTLLAKKTLIKAKELAPESKLISVLLESLESKKNKLPETNNEYCNHYIKAVKHFTVREYNHSLSYLNMFKKETPDMQYIKYLLAEIHFAKQDYKKVISLTEQSVKYDNADQYLYSLLIRSCINLNDMKKAKKFNSLLLKKYHKSALFNINLALINQKQGDYETAIIKATKAKNADPDLSESYSILGTLLFLKGKKEQAYQHFLKASSMNPMCVISNMALWSIHYIKKLFNSSDKYEFDLRHSRFFKPDFYLEWGEICIESKDYDQGLTAYKKALQFNKRNDVLLSKMAYAYYQKKDFKQAQAYISDALMINETNTIARKLDTIITFIQTVKFVSSTTVVGLVGLVLSLFVPPIVCALLMMFLMIIFLIVVICNKF